MSTFCVDVRKIDKVWDHPNADRLSLATVEGMTYQFVIGKDQFKSGDRVVYFPIDSVMPEYLQEAFGLVGKLKGKRKDRLGTVRLRGEISQGFVADASRVRELLIGRGHESYVDYPDYLETCDYMDLSTDLGVVKYEQPPIPCRAGRLVSLPSGVSMYDIEGADRYPQVLELLLDQPVQITEKVEGQNYGVTITPDNKVIVNQRRHAILPIEGEDKEHDLHKITREMRLGELAKRIRDGLLASQVTLRGEYVGPGIQKNIYKFQKNTVVLFDVLVDGNYVSPKKLDDIMTIADPEFDISTMWVPILAHGVKLRDWLDGRTIVEASHGDSMLGECLREGIVIKPLDEQTEESIGRLFLKQRDPIYLDKYGF